jgi:hypothetical protein
MGGFILMNRVGGHQVGCRQREVRNCSAPQSTIWNLESEISRRGRKLLAVSRKPTVRLIRRKLGGVPTSPLTE